MKKPNIAVSQPRNEPSGKSGVLKEALISTAVAAGVAAYAVRGKSSSLIAPSIWHGNRKRRAIALTFDDGPSESTPALLELLARHNAKATFFMCGQNARRLANIAREVAAAGHEIGNHTDSHPALYFRSPGFIHEEVARGQEAILETHSRILGCARERSWRMASRQYRQSFSSRNLRISSGGLCASAQ